MATPKTTGHGIWSPLPKTTLWKLKKVKESTESAAVIRAERDLVNADIIIFVVDKGSLIESGSHRELYRNEGIYKKLYDLQLPIEIGEQY